MGFLERDIVADLNRIELDLERLDAELKRNRQLLTKNGLSNLERDSQQILEELSRVKRRISNSI